MTSPHHRPRRVPATLTEARRALGRHRRCGDHCEAKSFYQNLIRQLIRSPLGWNIWTAENPDSENP